MNKKQGCLEGLGELFLVGWIFRALHGRFGVQKGSCIGCGCSTILFLIVAYVVLSIIFGTNWLHLVMLPFGLMA